MHACRRRRRREGHRGQSLLPLPRLRLAYPELLVDVGGLDEMRGVADAADALLIGARTTHYQLLHDPLVAEHAGLLAQAASTVADPAVRHGAPVRRCSRMELIFAVRGHAGLLRSDCRGRVERDAAEMRTNCVHREGETLPRVTAFGYL